MVSTAAKAFVSIFGNSVERLHTNIQPDGMKWDDWDSQERAKTDLGNSIVVDCNKVNRRK